MSKAGGSDSKNTLYCSFCGKSQHEVRKLIAGPTVFICDECVDLCMDIIGEENKRHRASLGFRYTQASAPERTHRGTPPHMGSNCLFRPIPARSCSSTRQR